MNTNQIKAAQTMLAALDPDPTRPGVIDTPKRMVASWQELYDRSPMPQLTTFDAEGYNQTLQQSSIQFYSLCEHHILPFFGTVQISYTPNKRIIGLSKLSRCVQWHARRLQTQERLTQQIGEALAKALEPRSLEVTITGRHLCMEMRGARSQGVATTTVYHLI